MFLSVVDVELNDITVASAMVVPVVGPSEKDETRGLPIDPITGQAATSSPLSDSDYFANLPDGEHLRIDTETTIHGLGAGGASLLRDDVYASFEIRPLLDSKKLSSNTANDLGMTEFRSMEVRVPVYEDDGKTQKTGPDGSALYRRATRLKLAGPRHDLSVNVSASVFMGDNLIKLVSDGPWSTYDLFEVRVCLIPTFTEQSNKGAQFAEDNNCKQVPIAMLRDVRRQTYQGQRSTQANPPTAANNTDADNRGLISDSFGAPTTVKKSLKYQTSGERKIGDPAVIQLTQGYSAKLESWQGNDDDFLDNNDVRFYIENRAWIKHDVSKARTDNAWGNNSSVSRIQAGYRFSYWWYDLNCVKGSREQCYRYPWAHYRISKMNKNESDYEFEDGRWAFYDGAGQYDVKFEAARTTATSPMSGRNTYFDVYLGAEVKGTSANGTILSFSFPFLWFDSYSSVRRNPAWDPAKYNKNRNNTWNRVYRPQADTVVMAYGYKIISQGRRRTGAKCESPAVAGGPYCYRKGTGRKNRDDAKTDCGATAVRVFGPDAGLPDGGIRTVVGWIPPIRNQADVERVSTVAKQLGLNRSWVDLSSACGTTSLWQGQADKLTDDRWISVTGDTWSFQNSCTASDVQKCYGPYPSREKESLRAMAKWCGEYVKKNENWRSRPDLPLDNTAKWAVNNPLDQSGQGVFVQTPATTSGTPVLANGSSDVLEEYLCEYPPDREILSINISTNMYSKADATLDKTVNTKEYLWAGSHQNAYDTCSLSAKLPQLDGGGATFCEPDFTKPYAYYTDTIQLWDHNVDFVDKPDWYSLDTGTKYWPKNVQTEASVEASFSGLKGNIYLVDGNRQATIKLPDVKMPKEKLWTHKSPGFETLPYQP